MGVSIPINAQLTASLEHSYHMIAFVTQALEHYTDIFDIKRAIVHTHLLNPEVINTLCYILQD